ncbi:MAG: peptidoglycan-binding protein [Candidatus Gracilibacteria bacterium]|nr:peptidoglycan-binding protein [Candidatus Gracilibacteria bacterium]
MKKILSLITILLIFVGIIPENVDAKSDTGYFVVTAYYSPLPNQKHYLTGDYESEVRLNGQGVKGASGKPVFPGMLAGPKTYDFGTKIYLEGLGIGEISDRGGAIVTAGNRGYSHDRIDVWMGYGDEGLQRALYWGKRTVKGNIIDKNSNITLNYEKVPSPAWASSGLKPQNNVFTFSLGVGSDIDKVKKLQDFFSDLGLYKGYINGVYNSEMIDIVYDYQVQNEIVSSPSDSGAGYWGNLTKDKFKKAYLNGDFDKEEIVESEVQAQPHPSPLLIEEGINGNNNSFDIFSQSISGVENIKQLQSILKEISFYTGEITGNYDDITDSIYTFQVENNIVKSEKDLGAGNFGPKTRETLKAVYASYNVEKEKAEKLLQEEENRKIELENKYREIEKSVILKVDGKTKDLLGVKFGEVSPRVRNLQLSLKELGYFDDKDTAIYGEKTKDAISDFQLENDLIDDVNSQYAGIIGERTISVIKEKLKTKYLKEELATNSDIDIDLLISYIPNLKI